ncbi:LLM class flavin-dependent oxidoreductase [Dactylosporangium sp. NPDC000244]|uniref:LLM class flavin-dependent oxidoreductase n=1 Tax=Dactylosporangium sp. NPDC000244 TaxID=3154365 RepID=UPI003323E6E2
MRIGYFLSCEEYAPAQLIEQARLAQDAGFQGLWISDHYHPWNDEQGQSPFVWSIIGALSRVVTIPITTAVTCPIQRIHPAIVAQAAATSAVLHDGRFILGVGSGEALNEQASELVTPERTAKAIACGPDPAAQASFLRQYEDAGFDEVYVANVGPHYAELIDLYRKEFL